LFLFICSVKRISVSVEYIILFLLFSFLQLFNFFILITIWFVLISSNFLSLVIHNISHLIKCIIGSSLSEYKIKESWILSIYHIIFYCYLVGKCTIRFIISSILFSIFLQRPFLFSSIYLWLWSHFLIFLENINLNGLLIVH